METPSTSHTDSNSTWTTIELIGLVATLIAAGFILWLAAEVVLLIFMGILIAILLSFLSSCLRDYTPLSYGWSLATVLLLLLVLVVASLGLAGARIAAETDNLTSNLQESWYFLASD